MKKNNFTILLLMLGATCMKAQVGVNTPTPTSTMDITAKNATGASTNVDGLLVPRVDRQRAQNMSGVPTSTLIYINSIATGTQAQATANVDAVGYYYYNGTVWVKIASGGSIDPRTVDNIYTNDGTLLANRTVTQANKTLTFTGNQTNAFSVDGSTFSADAANHRVGVGTTSPSVKLDVEGSQFLNAAITGAATKNALDINVGQDGYTYGNRTDNYGINMRTSSSAAPGLISRINFGDVNNSTSMNGVRYLSFSVGSTPNELMYLTDANSGRVGIGTITPQKTVHVNGSLQVTNELNVGGSGSNAGNAGNAGQFLSSNGGGAAPSWKDIPFDPSDGRVNVSKVSYPFVNVNSRDNGTYNLDGTNAPNYTIWVSISKGSGCDVQLPDPNSQERRTINIVAAGTNAVGVCGSPLYVTAANTINSIPAGKRVILSASSTFGGRWYVIMKDF